MTDKGDELLSCPFCGGEAYFDRAAFFEDHGRDEYSPLCSKCNATIFNDAYTTKEIAAEAWNKRTPTPPSDDLRAAMEALRPYTWGPWHLKVVGDVLAAWDAQEGDGM